MQIPGRNACGLRGCNAAIDRNPPSCPACRDVPTDDIFDGASCHYYCSSQHLSADKSRHEQECLARRTWRSMVRVGALYNMLFMCLQTNLFLSHMVAAEVDAEGLKLVTLARRKTVGGDSWDYTAILLPEVLGAWSFDQCRSCVAWLTPVLGWLVEDLPLRIDEKDLRPKDTPNRQKVYTPMSRSYKIATRHQVVTLTPTLTWPPSPEGLTLDATSMQYGHTVVSLRDSDYMRERADPAGAETQDFGHTYTEWVKDNRWCRKNTRSYREFAMEQIAIAKMHQAVWQKLPRREDRQDLLLDMSHEAFIEARDNIGRAVCAELQLLRPGFEKIEAADGQCDDDLERMREEQRGEGDEEIQERLMDLLDAGCDM
ncbi:hypothetical protein C7974DRAFT_418739 [Boeremia exigua]|uniref:uncharacterized protein n=1 Tax=Boeremia exigua TaxID=749465 RepID=UPI001E8DF609|nr:uncharacterized protein C7974DRAFT_418739 [Boeremia exigua]KAH6611826.1 hypothetical protein C7974DRAFT_418739 [Boeremia exigua]